MSASPSDQVSLWRFIVRCGLEEEYELDWLGRVKSKRTQLVLNGEITPELAQLLAGASAQIGGVASSAKAALASTPDNVRRLLSNLQETKGRQ